MIDLEEILKAYHLIKDHIKKTPLLNVPELEKKLNSRGRIYIKCENFQWTNSFKVRGAFNAILRLSEEEKKCGVVTRSAGNFAQAVAYAAQKLGIKAKIVVPDNIPKIKLHLTQQFGPEIVFAGPRNEDGDEVVKRIVESEGMTMLHPYNQINVIAGQGTLALEIYDELPSVKNFFAPIGGGGLLGGCAAAFKGLNKNMQIVGVEPAGAADYYNSRQAGKLIALENVDTIADGLRASCVGDLDWPLLQEYVDFSRTVTDSEIKCAMKYLKETMNITVEPSGATAFAELLLHAQNLEAGDTVVLISGGNVDPDMFEKWLSQVNDGVVRE